MPRGAVQQLLARDLFHHVRVDMAWFEKIYAMLQSLAVGPQRGEFQIFTGELGICGVERVVAARAENGVITEVGNDGATHRRNDGRAEEPCDATPDSHPTNESHTDSIGQ